MKRKIVEVIKAICFLALLGICFIGTTKLFQRKDSVIKFTPFFEEEKEYDVLFVGSSHVVNGVFPMELWEDYGIVSYNCGTHGSQLATTYWTMQHILNYKTPKLMVIDVFGVHYQEKYGFPEQLHEALDAFPMSYTKYKAVQDLFDDESSEDYDSRWSYFFDFDVYHTRWDDLKKEDFSYELNVEKGAESRINVAIPNEYPMCSIDEVMQDTNTVGMQYLCKMIEDCQSRGIEVLLVHIPYPCEPEWQVAANSVHAIADQYDVNYIDFVQMNNVVDYTIDCYDGGSHLNPSGARKVTDYLGRYIMSNYDIENRRDDIEYADWHMDYKNYKDYKIERLEEQTDLDNMLMLLRDKGFNACVYISAESGYLQNPVIHTLLANMSQYSLLTTLADATLSGSDYLLIVDHNRQFSQGYELQCEEVSKDTSMGQIIYEINKQGDKAIFVDDANILMGQGSEKVLAKVLVFERETGEIVAEFTQETVTES